MNRDVADLTSRAGAQALARTIVAYWAERGHKVAAEAIEYSEDVWGVRSDLVAGRPVKSAYAR